MLQGLRELRTGITVDTLRILTTLGESRSFPAKFRLITTYYDSRPSYGQAMANAKARIDYHNEQGFNTQSPSDPCWQI